MGLVGGVAHAGILIGARSTGIYNFGMCCASGWRHISEMVETATGINLWREGCVFEIEEANRIKLK